MSSNNRIDATLWGISDTELLAVVDDLADENGWTDTVNVRLQLGDQSYSEDTGRFEQPSGVGGRLAWMRRYGWLEGGKGTHRLTAMGHAILDNDGLPAAIVFEFRGLNAAQRVRMARELGEAGNAGPDEIRTALRRQWTRSLGRR
jgi:hypothetical protein